ncbi:PHP domain-containing protein [bacterium]|nr:PHP domain-containing protein [bacterium]
MLFFLEDRAVDPILFDLHCHTQEHSYDGHLPAVQLLQGSVEAGFSGVVITDHNTVWTADELADLRREAGVPEDFFLASGQEIRTAVDGIICGDLLAYGLTENIADGIDPAEVLRMLDEAGGFCLAAHVGQPRWGFCEKIADYPIRVAETWNGRYGNSHESRAVPLAEDYGLIQTGGSDAHNPDQVAGGGTILEERPADLADLGRILLAGKCKPWKPNVMKRTLRWLKRS